MVQLLQDVLLSTSNLQSLPLGASGVAGVDVQPLVEEAGNKELEHVWEGITAWEPAHSSEAVTPFRVHNVSEKLSIILIITHHKQFPAYKDFFISVL